MTRGYAGMVQHCLPVLGSSHAVRGPGTSRWSRREEKKEDMGRITDRQFGLSFFVSTAGCNITYHDKGLLKAWTGSCSGPSLIDHLHSRSPEARHYQAIAGLRPGGSSTLSQPVAFVFGNIQHVSRELSHHDFPSHQHLPNSRNVHEAGCVRRVRKSPKLCQTCVLLGCTACTLSWLNPARS